MADRFIDYIALSELSKRRHPGNPKRHYARGIKASVRRFGYVEQIHLDERTGYIIAGHGRLEEFEDGFSEHPESPPEGVRLEEDGEWSVPVVRGWASADDTEATAYLIGSNQLPHLGGWDEDGLIEALDEIRERDQSLLGAIGFDDEALSLAASAVLDEEPDVAPEPEPTLPEPGDAETGAGAGMVRYGVIIQCDDERSQRELLERFVAEGLDVRALMGA